jgi:glyoxylase-like metal-dependent hydrolase (beta-lactamase superfamily II)
MSISDGVPHSGPGILGNPKEPDTQTASECLSCLSLKRTKDYLLEAPSPGDKSCLILSHWDAGHCRGAGRGQGTGLASQAPVMLGPEQEQEKRSLL